MRHLPHSHFYLFLAHPQRLLCALLPVKSSLKFHHRLIASFADGDDDIPHLCFQISHRHQVKSGASQPLPNGTSAVFTGRKDGHGH